MPAEIYRQLENGKERVLVRIEGDQEHIDWLSTGRQVDIQTYKGDRCLSIFYHDDPLLADSFTGLYYPPQVIRLTHGRLLRPTDS